MAKRHISQYDLNLLVVLDSLLRTRSVTAAGVQVGLSQPSMSNALRRLRDMFGDKLFVRTRDGMKPTAAALRLADPVQKALELLRTALQAELSFNASEAECTFRLLLSDVGQIVLLPRLAQHLAQVAPGVRVRAIQIPRDRYRDALESGDADLAIGRQVDPHAGLHHRRLYTDRFVCLASTKHPRIRSGLTHKQFVANGHIAVVTPGTTSSEFETIVTQNKLDCRVALHVPHYLVAALIVEKSDLVVTIPEEIIAELPSSHQVKAYPLPFPASTFTVYQYWHERFHLDPGGRWLRQVVTSLFAE